MKWWVAGAEFGHSFWQPILDNADPGKAWVALSGIPATSGKLILWQAFQVFPRSCREFFISGVISALSLKASAAFEHFAGEMKQVTGGLMSSNWVKSLVSTIRSPQPHHLSSLNCLGSYMNQ